MKPVVIFGTSKVAALVHYFLTNDSPREVVAFTIDDAYRNTDTNRGLPVVSFEEMLTRYPPDDFDMFVGVGYSNMNQVRAAKYQAAKALGYQLVTYVSSKATTWPDLDIGDNCLIQENNVIQPFARIGSDVVMWSGCHIGHDSIVGDHSFLSSHVVVSGNVTIEPNCFFGVNSTVRDGITIRRESVIGAGSLIMKSTQPREVYLGQQSRLLGMSSDRLPGL